MKKRRSFKRKLKIILKRFYRPVYNAWERFHNWRQRNKTMRLIDYHTTVFFNRKLAAELQEMNDKLVYESRMQRILRDVSSINLEDFKRDYEKMIPELLLETMKKLSKLECHLRDGESL